MRVRLLLVILLAVLPLAATTVLLMLEARRSEIRHVQEQALQLARWGAAEQDGLIREARNLLEVLSLSPEATQGDRASCEARLKPITARNAWMTDLWISRPDGTIACSTRPESYALSMTGRPYFHRAMDTHVFTLGEFTLGRSSGRPVIVASLAFGDRKGAADGVLHVGIDLALLGRVGEEAARSIDGTLLIFDANGTALVHQPDPGGIVGRSFVTHPLFRTLSEAGAGAVEAPGLDGSEQIVGFTRLTGTPAMVAISVPRDRALALIDQETRIALLSVAAVVAAAGLAAWSFAGRSIARGIAHLVAKAETLGSGGRPDEGGPGLVGELRQLSSSLDGMAAQIEARGTAVRASEERLQSVLRAAAIGWWEFHFGENRILVSEHLPELLGYRAEDIADIAAKWLENVHPEDSGRVLSAFQAHLDGTTASYDVQYRLRAADGRWHWMSSRGMVVERDGSGRPLRACGTIQDVTELHVAEEAMRRSEALFRDAIEQLSEGFVLYDAEDRLVVTNSKYRELYALSADLLVPGTRHADIVRGMAARGQFAEPGHENLWLDPALTSRRRSTGEPLEQRLGDGKVLLVSDRRTTVGGWVGVRTDVTRLKRQEEALRRNQLELEQALADVTAARERIEGQAERLAELAARYDAERARAEAANAAKSEFLAAMSHEIRTPLNGVIGFADLLLETPLDDEQRRYVTFQREAGRTLLAVVNDILDWAKIEAGKLEVEPHPFDLHELLRGCEGLFSEAAERKGLTIRLEAAGDLPQTVFGDGMRLRQVLLNLLGNAVKFTARGGIVLSASPSPRPPASTGAGHVRFAVTDTGIGIPPERMEHLFERFSQIDASTSRRFGGTGLGLAICKQLVGLMGGTIGVESRPGEGSRFWFDLPLPLGTLPSPGDPVAKAERAARILLAEDVPMNQELAARVLRSAGHRVDIVGDGAEAVAAARKGTYDLILMDVQMPVLDGIEATRRIRAMAGSEGRVPILALTANAVREELDRCMAAGMNDTIVKPFAFAHLLEKVASWAGAATKPSTAKPGAAAEPTPAAPEPSVDERVVTDLRSVFGRIAFRDFVSSSAADIRSRIGAIEADLGDSATVAFHAHAMVSLAGNLGLTELSREARRLEALARSGESMALQAAFAGMRRAGDMALDRLGALGEAAE
ncbi:ATP-binding protein [Arenibaculum pallidiluteum]|uniref:ATP-binding protein n=1 Tax=Arenibaculum pallidiluteum TaxID=2812559 RepID=UPI001A97323B|nr:ATP-binding protein [Arenibaculum pallidiluteum]